MKIIRLHAENVKKLKVVDITPNTDVVVIGGKNGAGKSTVLDAIAYALGGQSLCPSVPIRTGEDTATVEVDLGDFLVTRKFSRTDAGIRSSLVVRNPAGIVQGTPQTILDGILGRYTFDPLAFQSSSPAAQLDTLRRLANVDTAEFENTAAVARVRRTDLNKRVTTAEVRLKDLPVYNGVPTEEVALNGVTVELSVAEELRDKFAKAQLKVTEVQGALAVISNSIDGRHKVIADLQRRLVEEEDALLELNNSFRTRSADLEAAQTYSTQLSTALPDVSALREKLLQLETTNSQVRANKKRDEARTELAELKAKAEAETAAIETALAQKQQVIATAKLPVPALGLTDEGVTYNGLPLEQASTAELLKISVSIGLALNPTLKVLLIKRGNDLDDDSMKVLAQLAADNNAQVWLERVANTKEGTSVLIEDGAQA